MCGLSKDVGRAALVAKTWHRHDAKFTGDRDNAVRDHKDPLEHSMRDARGQEDGGCDPHGSQSPWELIPAASGLGAQAGFPVGLGEAPGV